MTLGYLSSNSLTKQAFRPFRDNVRRRRRVGMAPTRNALPQKLFFAELRTVETPLWVRRQFS